MNPGMLGYLSPSSVESPEVISYIVESVDPEGPFGAKEASEGSLARRFPAISNAIFDAVGSRLREAPFTPERVLAAIRAQKGMKHIDLTDTTILCCRQNSVSMAARCGSKDAARSGMSWIRRGSRADVTGD